MGRNHTATRMSLLVSFLSLTPFLPAAIAQTASDDDAAMRSYLSANGLLNRGLYELAEDEYRKFLKESPRHEKAETARYGLAVCLFRTGRFDECARELDPLINLESFEFHAEALAMRGQCAFSAGDYVRAAQCFHRVIEQHADHDLADDAGALEVEALFRAGEHAAALKASERFGARWPKSAARERVEYFGALSAFSGKEYASAATALRELLERFPAGEFAESATLLLAQSYQETGESEKAAEPYERILRSKKSPLRAEALLGLAAVRQSQQRWDDCAKLAAEYLEIDNPPQTDDALAMLGRARFEVGKIDAAEQAFARVSAESAQADAAAYWIAKCHLRRGENADAAAALEKAIRSFPKSRWLAEMRYDRALACYRAEDYEAAITALSEFLKSHAESPLAAGALQMRAAASRALKRYADARRDCASFAERYPNDAAAASVAFLAAEIEALDGQAEAAAKAYAEFERRFPQEELAATASARHALLLFRLERFDEARPLLEKSAQTDGPEALSARLALADLALQAGEWSQAEDGLRAYLREGGKQPGAADAMLKLGIALERQNRHEDALAIFERLLKDHEQGPHAAQARFERAQTLLALGREDDAVRAFEGMLDDESVGRFAPYARRHLASIHLARRDSDRARAQIEALLRAAPNDELATDARYQLLDVEFLAANYDKVVTLADALLRAAPKHDGAGRAAAIRAVSLARLDRFEPALKAFEAITSENRTVLGEDLQLALAYEQAWCLRRLDRTEEAAALFRRLAETHGTLGMHAQVELAEIAAAAGDSAKAAAVLESLGDMAELPPALREKATYRAGVCQFQLEHFDQAAKVLDRFCEEFSESTLLASAAYFAGEANFRTGRFEAAGRFLGRVVREFPKDPAAEAALLRLGEASAAMQQWAASEKAYVDYLERFPKSERWFQAQFGIGWARENLERFDEAISAYRVVVDKHQGETAARAQFQIGECLYAKKEHEQAVRELLKVDILYAYPDWSAAALFEAGRCFEQLNKPAEARVQFQTVVEKYGQTRWAQPARQRLATASTGAPPGRSP